MTQTIEVPDFATGEDFDGEHSSIIGMERCECCGLAAYPDADDGRRVLSDDGFLGVKHICGHCARQIKNANEKRPKGCAAFYGSGPLAIPGWNTELRKYIAEVEANWLFRGKKRKVPTKRKHDYCPVGGQHPRLTIYLNGVESGKIQAPWTSASIQYPEGVEHAKNCRCAECSQLTRGKASAELREIFWAVQQAQHECGLRAAQRRQENPGEQEQGVAFYWQHERFMQAKGKRSNTELKAAA